VGNAPFGEGGKVKFQPSTGILDVMQQRLLHIADVARLKIHRACAISSRDNRHSPFPGDKVLPLVCVWMPMQRDQPHRVYRR
jgi:hypothetical protein